MNKKLLKSIVCIAAGVGIATSIPFTTTSCGFSSQDDDVSINPLPIEVYNIQNNVLKGFKEGIDWSQYNDGKCDTIEVPANVSSIETEAFKLEIPDFIKKIAFEKGSKCSQINSCAFSGNPSLTSVYFSNATSLSSMTESVFRDCEGLTFANFSKAIKLSSIGQYTFVGCSALSSVILPDNLEIIDNSVFNNCSKLTSVTFPISLKEIGNYAFQNCSLLPSLDLSNTSLTTINSLCFQDCTSLKSIKFPNSLTTIGKNAFYNCSKLTSIDFLKATSLKTIGEESFKNCSALTSLNLSTATNLSTINGCAFSQCSSLTSVTFPKSLNNIEHDAFENCSNLSSIVWNSWAGNTDLVNTSFSGVCQTGGTVTVTNPSGRDSDELLQYLLDNGGLPPSWGPAPEKLQIKYNGTEESKNLDTIGLYENPQTTSSSGTFSIIPEKPSSFSWSFNVFYNNDPQAGDYVIWDEWRTWIKLEINNLNQLQVTYIRTGASPDIYAKVEVFGVTSDSSRTNTISGFNFRVFC